MAKYMGHWCSGTEDSFLAVMVMSAEAIRKLRSFKETFEQVRAEHDEVLGLEFSNIGSIRFFDKIFNDAEEAVDALYDAAEEVGGDGDELDHSEGWFPLPDDIDLPQDGDYRTAYETIRVSEYGMVVQGQGKHSSEVFEADLWALLTALDEAPSA